MMKQFLGIKAKPLKFASESGSEYVAHAFGWNFWATGGGDVWHMEVSIAYVSFYQLECDSKEAAITAANQYFQSHLAEWLEVAE